LVNWFTVTPLCVSLTMSPSGEYLATVHAGSPGIYLRANSTLYSNVLLHPLPEAYDPLQLDLPMITLDGRDENNEVAGEAEADDSVPGFKSSEQISVELATLSLVSKSHWLNLLDLDIIKESGGYVHLRLGYKLKREQKIPAFSQESGGYVHLRLGYKPKREQKIPAFSQVGI
ncbi:WD repeat-containing protein 36, partial [Araneus ventricosus]